MFIINSDQLVGLQLRNTSKQFENTIKYLRSNANVLAVIVELCHMLLLLILKKPHGQAASCRTINLKADLMSLSILETFFFFSFLSLMVVFDYLRWFGGLRGAPILTLSPF